MTILLVKIMTCSFKYLNT